ncbi:hypothetical protein OG216_09970 [Streptomycetaceae bacterium NBC_01309]
MTGGAELQQGETLAGDLPDELATKAMRTVASYATDAVDARDLLEMLGLIDAPPTPNPTTGCGTAQGWRQHKSGETEPCQPCLDAWARYHRERGARGEE